MATVVIHTVSLFTKYYDDILCDRTISRNHTTPIIALHILEWNRLYLSDDAHSAHKVSNALQIVIFITMGNGTNCNLIRPELSLAFPKFTAIITVIFLKIVASTRTLKEPF